ncbi:MAG: hypothetical protein Q4B42_07390 [Oscillospiraceae bacterium]|nr:hypothetical protein [Oscillospiraceae bacterium]
MSDQNKQLLFIFGELSLPLKIGQPAMIFSRGRSISTPCVDMIREVALDFFLFETKSSVYCVSSKEGPEADAKPALWLCA